MIKNLKRFKKSLAKEGRVEEAESLNFFPQTFNMPGEYSLFVEEFKRNPSNVWIMKPVGKCQGRGIFLFTKLQHVSQWKNELRWKPDNPSAEPYVAQRYLNNPLLVGGKKFDLRIYVLCTSYSPMTLYLYRTGFARFTHHRYTQDDIQNQHVHLTNVAVQKTSENYDSKIGGKWDLRLLKLYLISRYGAERVNECFYQIQQIFIKSFLSVQKVMINDKHCYELYGFDVLIDNNFKPWLIECNASPSLTANTKDDAEMKIDMLDDLFTVVDMEKILTGNEEQVGGFDLIYKNNPIKLPANSMYQTYLGCHNSRQQNLKRLARQVAQRLSKK